MRTTIDFGKGPALGFTQALNKSHEEKLRCIFMEEVDLE
jgi:hypothetical protein